MKMAGLEISSTAKKCLKKTSLSVSSRAKATVFNENMSKS